MSKSLTTSWYAAVRYCARAKWLQKNAFGEGTSKFFPALNHYWKYQPLKTSYVCIYNIYFFEIIIIRYLACIKKKLYMKIKIKNTLPVFKTLTFHIFYGRFTSVHIFLYICIYFFIDLYYLISFVPVAKL